MKASKSTSKQLILQSDAGADGYFDRQHFVQVFGGVYEHSPWLAEAVFDSAPDAPIGGGHALVKRFEQVFLNSDKARQLEVLQAHPELACQRADEQPLTAASRQEQSGSGLDQCSEQELNKFLEMNHKYMNKNGFPFIIAVKGLRRSDILECFEERLANHRDIEFEAALKQVNRIARLRIEAILDD